MARVAFDTDHLLGEQVLAGKQILNKTRILWKSYLTGLPRGDLFWGERATAHTQATIKLCHRPLHDIEPHVRVKHKLIWTLCPFGRFS